MPEAGAGAGGAYTKSQTPSLVYILIEKPRTPRMESRVAGEHSCTTVEKRTIRFIFLHICTTQAARFSTPLLTQAHFETGQRKFLYASAWSCRLPPKLLRLPPDVLNLYGICKTKHSPALAALWRPATERKQRLQQHPIGTTVSSA